MVSAVILSVRLLFWVFHFVKWKWFCMKWCMVFIGKLCTNFSLVIKKWARMFEQRTRLPKITQLMNSLHINRYVGMQSVHTLRPRRTRCPLLISIFHTHKKATITRCKLVLGIDSILLFTDWSGIVCDYAWTERIILPLLKKCCFSVFWAILYYYWTIVKRYTRWEEGQR